MLYVLFSMPLESRETFVLNLTDAYRVITFTVNNR